MQILEAYEDAEFFYEPYSGLFRIHSQEHDYDGTPAAYNMTTFYTLYDDNDFYAIAYVASFMTGNEGSGTIYMYDFTEVSKEEYDQYFQQVAGMYSFREVVYDTMTYYTEEEVTIGTDERE